MPAGPGALGKVTRSVDRAGREAARLRTLQLQRQAAALLPDERVRTCLWAVVSRGASVRVELRSYEGDERRASFRGLQLCGSVWLCPVCSRRIGERRRGELNALLAWARGQGLWPVMLTLTARHGLRDDLVAQLDAMKRAKRRLRQRREWRAIQGAIAGTVTATEVTHGAAGWHTHFHEIVLVRAASEAAAVAMLDGLAPAWLACLRGLGLDGLGERAWRVQGAGAAGSYVAKWGAAEELTLSGQKAARGKGRTPLQLLAAAREGDGEAAALWRAYGLAFKGRRQLVWSPGLRALVGLDDVSDEEAAAEGGEGAEPAGVPEPEVVAEIGPAEWYGRPGVRGARHRRAQILDAAERGGAAAVLELLARAGPDDGVDPVELVEPDG